MISMKFNVNLSRLRSNLREEAKKKAIRIAQEIVNGVIARSPVLAGDYRSSWNVSEGSMEFKFNNNGNPASPTPAPAIVVSSNVALPHFYITNGAPYAQQLEKGSSTQAPLGIVRVTLASLR